MSRERYHAEAMAEQNYFDGDTEEFPAVSVPNGQPPAQAAPDSWSAATLTLEAVSFDELAQKIVTTLMECDFQNDLVDLHSERARKDGDYELWAEAQALVDTVAAAYKKIKSEAEGDSDVIGATLYGLAPNTSAPDWKRISAEMRLPDSAIPFAEGIQVGRAAVLPYDGETAYSAPSLRDARTLEAALREKDARIAALEAEIKAMQAYITRLQGK